MYMLSALTPSSPLEILFNDPMATQEQMEAMEKALGLDQPVYIQYWHWLKACRRKSWNILSYRTSCGVHDSRKISGQTLILTGTAMLITSAVSLPLELWRRINHIPDGITFLPVFPSLELQCQTFLQHWYLFTSSM